MTCRFNLEELLLSEATALKYWHVVIFIVLVDMFCCVMCSWF